MKKLIRMFAILGIAAGCTEGSKELVQKQGIMARHFELSDVELLDSPFKTAFESNKKWLLDLSPDRFLHRFRSLAGLEPKDSIYGGWESRGISGQTLGHYLTALTMMYAVTGENEFKRRADYIVSELAECQVEIGTGFVGAFPEFDRIFEEVARGDVRSAGFDLNGGWVPWYNLHKTFAGLIDSYRFTNNELAKTVVVNLGNWAINTVGGLNETQFQKMLACEHGGMNESLAELYAITGDERYFELAERFNHKAVLEPLTYETDLLAGLHANTQIPKVVGLGRQYEYNGGKEKRDAAAFFWDRVVHHHSYVIGANSDYEHFGPADSLNGRLSKNSAETCNTYNMLKLTKELHSWEPTVEYADYYERALYNHILASQNPSDGMITYYVNMKPGEKKVFSTPFDSFWCCVGTGIENHVKYGEFIYSHAADTLWVNLFIPSSLDWKEQNARLVMETSYPKSDQVKMTVHVDESKQMAIKVRVPDWSKGGAQLKVNGTLLDIQAIPGTYALIDREWKDGDEIEWQLDMELYTEPLPGDPYKIAMLYGPLVLAADLGKEEVDPTAIPALILGDKDIAKFLVEKEPLQFELREVVKPAAITLKPFYEIVEENYTIYLDVLDEAGWRSRYNRLKRQAEIAVEVERRTIDVVRIGEMQPERDHEFRGEKTDAGGGTDKWRHATDGGWFSYQMDLKGRKSDLVLRCRYFGPDEGNRNFDIMIDGKKVATQSLNGGRGNEFFFVNYPIPNGLLVNKQLITVRFQAHPGATAGGVFGCSLLDVSGGINLEI